MAGFLAPKFKQYYVMSGRSPVLPKRNLWLCYVWRPLSQLDPVCFYDCFFVLKSITGTVMVLLLV
jgi:hypothetical protein